jgi:hypothetical protein
VHALTRCALFGRRFSASASLSGVRCRFRDVWATLGFGSWCPAGTPVRFQPVHAVTVLRQRSYSAAASTPQMPLYTETPFCSPN